MKFNLVVTVAHFIIKHNKEPYFQKVPNLK